MRRPHLIVVLLAMVLLSGLGLWVAAQEQGGSGIRVVVNMVQLNVAVTDGKGRYVTGLRASDFEITEDKILQEIATFEQGSASQRAAGAAPDPDGQVNAFQGSAGATSTSADANGTTLASAVSGANVFILFDTSNYMYRGRGFVFAQDAITQFIRTLESPNRIAFYAYSRDVFRATPLTANRMEVLRGVRSTTNGDDSALYNALLLTLKDASQQTGRRVVVVFSNGPDNASMVAPEDVDELAQSQGIPIYMISTHEARLDRATAAVFGRMSANTGGEVYFAKSWKDQGQAFESIREDLANLYFLSYYPQQNPNRGWRSITVRLKDRKFRGYRIRTRSGYRPIPARMAAGLPPAPNQAP